MKHLITIVSLLMLLSSCCGSQTDNSADKFGLTSAELSALLVPVELYIESGVKGTSECAKRAFVPQATMSHVEADSIVVAPIRALYDFYDQTGPQDCSYELADCSVAGDAAMVRIESVFGEARFTDMFTMLKQGGEWRIVSKIFTVK